MVHSFNSTRHPHCTSNPRVTEAPMHLVPYYTQHTMQYVQHTQATFPHTRRFQNPDWPT